MAQLTPGPPSAPSLQFSLSVVVEPGTKLEKTAWTIVDPFLLLDLGCRPV